MIALALVGTACTAALAALGARRFVLAPLERRAGRTRLGTTRGKHPVTPAPPAFDPAVFLERIAREVRLGSSPTAAFVAAYDTSPTHAPWAADVATRCRRGVSLSDAIAECADPTWPTPVRDTARTLAIAARGGAGVAPALERGASLIRDAAGLAAERHTASAHARASVAMLTTVPLVLFALTVSFSAHARTAMLATPGGLVACLLGVSGNAAGRRWMRGLIDGSRS